MSKVTYAFKLDDNLKFDLENVCEELGITLPVFFTMAAKKLVRERKLEIDLSSEKDDYFYSEENIARLLKAKQQIEKTGGTVHEVL